MCRPTILAIQKYVVAFEIEFQIYFFLMQKGMMFCYKSSTAPCVQFHTPLDLSTTNTSRDGTASERLQISGEIKSENLSQVSFSNSISWSKIKVIWSCWAFQRTSEQFGKFCLLLWLLFAPAENGGHHNKWSLIFFPKLYIFSYVNKRGPQRKL